VYLLTDSGQIVQCMVLTGSGQSVQCDVLTESGQTIQCEVVKQWTDCKLFAIHYCLTKPNYLGKQLLRIITELFTLSHPIYKSSCFALTDKTAEI